LGNTNNNNFLDCYISFVTN